MVCQPSVTVGFNGGPYSETTAHGLFARVIVNEKPPFVCIDADGRWEHYVAVDDCPEHVLCFEYTGPCRDRKPHEPCGHNHEEE